MAQRFCVVFDLLMRHDIRLRWNYRPDSDLYVIYTAGQAFASLVSTNPPQFYENRLAIKLRAHGDPELD
jgi:hypothetical protein